MIDQPQQIGRYLVQRPLGQGAMGTVYLAEDPLLKRRLAIKVVKAVGEERDIALERFKREAEISAQLNHPNVVTIYDVGEAPGLGPFLAMEYVEGQSLGKLIRQGNLDPETKFALLIQAMRALRAAHRHAIVHRDVKPDNLLVGEDGRIKLMDFGIARTMAPRMTAQGEFLGSPAYSAPEMLRGADPTPSSDRFAFAVMAYELLTGSLPHPGNSVAAVITHILTEPPVIPQGMSGDVAKVFRKALAQDPDERYDNLVEFLMDLAAAHPFDELARGRLAEFFRHDDISGDIIPARLQRARAALSSSSAGEQSSASGSSTGARNLSVRPTPMLPQPPAVKIELEAPQLDNPRSSRPQAPAPGFTDQVEIKTLLFWILGILGAGQLFWWIYAFVSGH